MQLPSLNPLTRKIIWRFLAVAAVVAYSIRFTLASLIEMHQLHFRGDLAAIWQAIYSLAVWGEPFSTFNCSVHQYWSISGTPGILDEQQNVVGCNQLGIHFHGLIYLLALLARVYPYPELLVYIQSFVIAAGAWFLFLLAERVMLSGFLAFGVLLTFLANPFLHGLHLNDFHFDAFMPLFIFLALYLLELRKFWGVACLAVASMFIKESFPLLVFSLGCFVVLSYRGYPRARMLGLGLILLGPITLHLLTKIIMPTLSFTGDYMFGAVYGSKLGASPSEIIWTCLTKPTLFWSTLTTPANLEYMRLLLGTSSILVLLYPEVLLVAGPLFFINIVSNNLGMKVPWGQYNAAVISACVAAIPFAYRRLHGWGKWAARLGGLVLLMSVGVSLHREHEKGTFRIPNTAGLEHQIPELLALPQESRVCVDDIFSSYAGSRAEMYLIPVNLVRCDKVLWQKPDPEYISAANRQRALEYVEKHFYVQFENERLRIYSRTTTSQ